MPSHKAVLMIGCSIMPLKSGPHKPPTRSYIHSPRLPNPRSCVLQDVVVILIPLRKPGRSSTCCELESDDEGHTIRGFADAVALPQVRRPRHPIVMHS
jgi:hypothetical protein